MQKTNISNDYTEQDRLKHNNEHCTWTKNICCFYMIASNYAEIHVHGNMHKFFQFTLFNKLQNPLHKHQYTAQLPHNTEAHFSSSVCSSYPLCSPVSFNTSGSSSPETAPRPFAGSLFSFFFSLPVSSLS